MSLPDDFELTQIYAIQRGDNIGDIVNPLTGEIVGKAKGQTSLSVIKKQSVMDKIISKIKKTYSSETRVDMDEGKKDNGQEHLIKPSDEKNTDTVKESLTSLSARVKQLQEKCRELLTTRNKRRDMEIDNEKRDTEVR